LVTDDSSSADDDDLSDADVALTGTAAVDDDDLIFFVGACLVAFVLIVPDALPFGDLTFFATADDDDDSRLCLPDVVGT